MMGLRNNMQEKLFVEKYLKQVNDSYKKLSKKIELTKNQEDKIVKVLKNKYSDKTLQYKYIVKPDLLGGIQEVV